MASWTLRACVFLALSRLSTITCQSGEQFDQVLKDTMTLDSKVRPVKNASTTTNVTVSFHLMSIINLDTVEQKLLSNGFLTVKWDNEYFTWKPWEYGGVYVVNPDPDKVWRPRVTIHNTMKDLKPIGEDYIMIMALFNGTMTWFPAEHFETFCQVDVTYFPFDIQTCEWRMFIWGTNTVQEVSLQPSKPAIDLDSFVPNGEWELRATRAWREIHVQTGGEILHLFYQATLRRRPSLLALTVLLPVLVLAMVNVFVFTVPSESGERLTYSITSLLSFGVFLSFIMDSMPSSTDTISILAINISCQLVLSAAYVLLCILSLRLFHCDPAKHPVSSTVQSLVVCLEVLVCLDPPNKHKRDVIGVAETDVASSNVTDLQNDVGMMDGELNGKLDKRLMTKKVKHAAYRDPEEMTWQRVSRMLDKLFFRFFIFLVLVFNGATCGVLVNNYLSSN